MPTYEVIIETRKLPDPDLVHSLGAPVDACQTLVDQIVEDNHDAALTEALKRIRGYEPEETRAPWVPMTLEQACAFVDDLGKQTLHGPLPTATVYRLLEAAVLLRARIGV
jgi:hypothetical protein